MPAILSDSKVFLFSKPSTALSAHLLLRPFMGMNIIVFILLALLLLFPEIKSIYWFICSVALYSEVFYVFFLFAEKSNLDEDLG